MQNNSLSNDSVGSLITGHKTNASSRNSKRFASGTYPVVTIYVNIETHRRNIQFACAVYDFICSYCDCAVCSN